MSIALHREALLSSRKSVRAASLQLQILHSKVHDVLHKRLHLGAYKIQMIHAPKQSDQVARTNFAMDMLQIIDVSPSFLHQVCFSDKAMSHVTCELERGNTKVNMWAGLMHNKLIGLLGDGSAEVDQSLGLLGHQI
jgi:hypothetical protein